MNDTSMNPDTNATDGSDTLTDTPPEPRTVEVRGRKVVLTCTGAGTPTVILETGLGAESAEWLPIQRAIEKHTRVFSYDRAGRGASERPLQPRSAAEMVEELWELTCQADIQGPYILVGHSFGGLLMRLFAHRYRQHARALVLVDSMHEDQFEVFGPRFPPPTPSDPPQIREVRRFWTGGWRDPASTAERIDFAASIRQARQIDTLGALPVHILTAGTFSNSTLVPAELRPELQQQWEILQRQFLRLSAAATQSFLPGSGHFIQRDSPKSVIDVVRAMIG